MDIQPSDWISGLLISHSEAHYLLVLPMTLDHLSRPVNQVLKKAPKAQTHDLSGIFLRPVKRPNINPLTALEVLAGKIPILDRSYDGMKVLSMAKTPNIYLAWSLFLRV